MRRPSSDEPDRIDLNDKASRESWVRRLNTTHEKLRETAGAVGDDPHEVEKHLRKKTEEQRGGRGTM